MPLKRSATEIKDVLTTQGDILIRDATEPARLGYGTSGQFLKTQGAGANPVWAAGGAHLEAKRGKCATGAGSNYYVDVMWTTAFSVTPIVALGAEVSGSVWVDSITKTGCRLHTDVVNRFVNCIAMEPT